MRWSRGRPELPDESKDALFEYLDACPDTSPDSHPDPNPDAGPVRPIGKPAPGSSPCRSAERERAEAREAELRERYRLEPLRNRSTAAVYRKGLYLIDLLERAARGLDLPPSGAAGLRALDIGSQDWHYAFALERWLAYGNEGERAVELRGVEIDGYGIYPDLRSRRDHAQAYAASTGNPRVTYEVGDFLRAEGSGLDLITWFYPFVFRHHLLLWGLPLRHYRPERMIARAVGMLRPGGWMVVLCHTLPEHEAFLTLARAQGGLELVRAGEARSRLVDFHADVEDRRFSLWRRR